MYNGVFVAEIALSAMIRLYISWIWIVTAGSNICYIIADSATATKTLFQAVSVVVQL